MDNVEVVDYIKVVDKTDGGECSRCGECCSDILPITKKEIIEIKKYLEENNVKLDIKVRIFPELVIDVSCPFFSKKEKKCLIYDVRPDICKTFKCDYPVEYIRQNKKKIAEDRKSLMISMHHTFAKEGYVREAMEKFISQNPILTETMSRVRWEGK